VTVVINVLHSVHLFIILFISNISMPQTRNQATAKKAKTLQETKKRSSPCSNRRFASKKSSSPRSNCSKKRAKRKAVVQSEEKQRQNTKRPRYDEESHLDDETDESYDASNSSGGTPVIEDSSIDRAERKRRSTKKKQLAQKCSMQRVRSDSSIGSTGSGSVAQSDSEVDVDTPKTQCTIVCNKINDLLIHVEKKLCASHYSSSERKFFFNNIYTSVKSYIKKKKATIKVKRTGGNKSWDYMFTSWKCYAEEFPDKKNNVCIETHGRLNNWVKEQRRKFVNNILTDQRFQQLRSEGFDFAPRKGTGLDRKLPAKHEVNEMINASVIDPPEDCRDVPSAKPPSEDIPVSSIVATVEVVGSEPNEAINASVKIPPEDCRDVPSAKPPSEVISAKPPSEVIGVTPIPLSEEKGIFDLPSNTVSSGRKDDDIPVSSTVAAVEVVGEPNEAINASVKIPQDDCRDVLSAKPPSEVIGVTPIPLSEAKGIFDLPSNTVSSGCKDDDIPVSSTVGKRKRLPKKAKALVPLQNERILRSASVKENRPKMPQLIDKPNKPVINVDEIENPPPSSDETSTVPISPWDFS